MPEETKGFESANYFNVARVWRCQIWKPFLSRTNYIFECTSRPRTKVDRGRWTGLNNVVPVISVISVNVGVIDRRRRISDNRVDNRVRHWSRSGWRARRLPGGWAWRRLGWNNLSRWGGSGCRSAPCMRGNTVISHQCSKWKFLVVKKHALG